MGKRKDHSKIAEGLARGLSKREAVRQAGYSSMTAEKKAYAIVKRPLVQSALTEAIKRQGMTLERILKPVIDALHANVVVRSQRLGSAHETPFPDHDLRIRAADLLISLYGGAPKAVEIPPQPSKGLVVIIRKDGAPAEQQKPVDVTPQTKIEPQRERRTPPLDVRIARDSEP